MRRDLLVEWLNLETDTKCADYPARALVRRCSPEWGVIFFLSMSPNLEAGSAVLLYDGECGLCTRIVQFVLRVESERTLRFAPLAGEFARGVLSRHRELAGVDSIVWVVRASDPSRELVSVRSEAAISMGRYLGGGWRVVAQVARWIPRGLRDRIYDWVARRRRRWFANATTCLVLDRRQQERLIS